MRRLSCRAALLILLASVNGLIWHAVLAERGAMLKVVFLDVGQGDAIFIESPSGAQALIDGGANGKVLSELGAVMPFYDKSLDVVIATHPDKDHIGGLADVVGRYEVGVMLESGAKSETGIDDALHALAGERGIERIVAKRGQTIDLGGGAKLFVLFPDRDASAMETNGSSVVAKLVYGETSFLLTGDSPKQVEALLRQAEGPGLDSDVLKAGHHGSDTSSSPGFVSAVSPAYAVISAGKDNTYGHPHREAVETLAAAGAAILGTYDEGRIIFESDGKAIRRK